MVQPPDTNLPEMTVSELSFSLKRAVEDRFGHVRVRGELSGVKRAASGHIYMAMKDDQAVLDTVCWRGVAGRLPLQPEDGLEVVATGKLTTYPGRSKYQLVVETMEVAGAGALMALLEKRKEQFAAEGLFAAERKKPIPYLPSVIGVVTSPTGSVIRDILHRLQDRFPRRVLVWPVKVQGEGAADEVAAAIHGFNGIAPGGPIPRPDVLIVARGGGSIEDLWSFNEEVVVRAAAASQIPLISAVGHETDTTLIDYVADLRAPTPTAAAEHAVPVRSELAATVADLNARLDRGRASYYERLNDRLTGLARGLPKPREIFGLASQRLDDLADRLPRGLQAVARDRQVALGQLAGGLSRGRLTSLIDYKQSSYKATADRLDPVYRQRLKDAAAQLDGLDRLLRSLSHEAVLKRGFAALFDDQGQPLTSVGMLPAGLTVTAQMHDGQVGMTVGESATPAPPKKSTVPRKNTKKSADSRQESLF